MAGCGILFVIAIVGVIGLAVLGSWGASKLIADYTADKGLSIDDSAVTDGQYAIANEKFSALLQAIGTKQPLSVELTTADVNALIARHPSFAGSRGKCQVAMGDSLGTVEFSVPLSEIQLPQFKGRWLNGTACFGLAYANDSFSVAIQSLNINGHELPPSFVGGFSESFNTSLNEKFAEARQEDPAADQIWANVAGLAVQEDRLVITTSGPPQ